MSEPSKKKSGSIRGPRSFSIDRPGENIKEKTASPKAEAKAVPRRPKSMKVTKEIILQSDDAVNEAYGDIEQLTPPPPSKPIQRGFGWGKLAIAAFSMLFAISMGLAIDELIRNLFSRNDWLGWAALGLTAIGAIALLALVLREIWGIARLRNLEKLRMRGASAVENDNLKEARSVSKDIISLFAARFDTAHGRAKLSEHSQDILDGADLIHLVERDLLAPLDKTARSMVMASAKRVSVVTAVSPRALVDIGFVLFENMRLIRRISEHYGGRPGTLSSLRLARGVVTHLAATGTIAIGDGLLQQVIGQGLAARLSARLGEGVVNGLLTARIGIAAIDVCRPLKFDVERRPGISDFLTELTNFKKNVQESEK
ncbi:MAG: TIGR01620 family protein [Salaquimonas sp.]